MPQLIIEQPGVPPITIPLALDGRDVMLGRAEDNSVALVADEVSRHHAKIVQRGDKIFLIDLNSMNGTYVNRQRIVERVLSHMDDIWLGSKCHMVYRDDTGFGKTQDTQKSANESSIIENLAEIRAEMDRVGNSMTLIGRPGMAVEAVREAGMPEDVVKMGRAYRRLSALYEASKLMASDFDLTKRLAAMLDTAIDVMDAERGFVLLRDETSGGLTVKVAREMGQELQASSPSMGIAGRAAIDGEPVLMENREQDQRFGGRESIIQQRIASAMCVPLKAEGRIFGSIYLDTRKPGSSFVNEDLELFAALAAQSAMAIENVRLYEQTIEAEKTRANLGRFLSPAIVEEVMKQDTRLELGGAKCTVTTMFCDIRGFTPIAEQLTPAELVSLLNEHFTAMTDIIFAHEGTLDKYIGDEIMAVFGAPISSPDDPARAVRAALAMQEKNAELNEQRKQSARPTFDLGIGINTGEAIAGYVGSPERMEFTVVGDSVNTARRFCTLAAPGQVVAGEETHRLVAGLVEARPTGSVMLKGKARPAHGFHILAMKQ